MRKFLVLLLCLLGTPVSAQSWIANAPNQSIPFNNNGYLGYINWTNGCILTYQTGTASGATGGFPVCTTAAITASMLAPGAAALNLGALSLPAANGLAAFRAVEAGGTGTISNAPGSLPMIYGDYTNGATYNKHVFEASLNALTTAGVVTGAADNGSGLVRLAISTTSYLTTGDTATVTGVLGTTEANGSWTITVIDATHVDLQGSAYVQAYTSGGLFVDTVSVGTPLNDNVIVAAIYTPPDNGGDSSAVYGINTGGGNAASFFNLCGSTPAGFTQYCNNGRAIEAGVDGGKNSIVSTAVNGASFFGLMNGAGIGLLIQPVTDGVMTRQAIAVNNAASSTQYFFVDLGGDLYAAGNAQVVGHQSIGAYATVGSYLTVGTTTEGAELTVSGAGQATDSFSTTAPMTGALLIDDTGAAGTDGGALVFSAANQAWKFAAIKGDATVGTGNSQGDIAFLTRPIATNTTLSLAMKLHSSGGLSIGTNTDPGGGGLIASSVGTSGTPVANGYFTSLGSTTVPVSYATFSNIYGPSGFGLNIVAASGQSLSIGGNGAASWSFDASKNFLPIADNVSALGSNTIRISNAYITTAKITPVAIASLPTCNSTNVGDQGFINNGVTAPTYHLAVSSTGTGQWPVYCTYNGTTYSWVY